VRKLFSWSVIPEKKAKGVTQNYWVFGLPTSGFEIIRRKLNNKRKKNYISETGPVSAFR
jgi:hypothetical protein